jgi:uncharacterized membrane protein YjjP (DUF1212 family)
MSRPDEAPPAHTRADPNEEASDPRAARGYDAALLHAFLLEVGRGLSLAGTAVSETQERLSRIAAANGATEARVVAFPTVLMISLGPAEQTTVEAIPQRTGALRLDQISVLYKIVKDAERGTLPLDKGLERVRGIRAMRPRHGHGVEVLAYTLRTIGICLILQPTLLDVTVAAGLGALIGTVVLATENRQSVSVLVPIFSAALVAWLTFVAVQHGAADPGLRTMIAPLVMFLPGAALTTATVELASGEMIAGASRLVFGGLQMLLLAFGIIAGVSLAGLPSHAVPHDVAVNLLGWWAPWLGVVVFGLATGLSAPRDALGWLLLVLLAAWLGQLVGSWLVNPNVSGFFGALAMTPLALAIARLRSGPPAQVTFLPAFWLLVPGAMGLIGVTEIVGNPANAGLEDLIKPVASIVAIALGVLCGTTIYRGLAAAPKQLSRFRLSGSRPA